VDQQGQAAAGLGGQALQAAVVVDVTVGDDDGPPSYRIELRRPPENTVTRAEKPCSATSCPGRTGRRRAGAGTPYRRREQDVDEVVDHQGDLDGIDRLQLDHAG